MLQWGDIVEKVLDGKKMYRLTFWSDDKSSLEQFEQKIITGFTRCEHCGGEVVQSGDGYLCLGGDGHVKGKIG